MAWMTKGLALDLLAILTNASQSAFDRIKEEPDQENWPPAEKTPDEPETPKQDPAPTPKPDAQEPPAVDNTADLLTEAKNLLQSISAAGGRDWIKTTLLPKFGVAKLSDVPADKLPALIEAAKNRKKETQ
ncbi:hypothetical protein [Corynebacterium lujinxingii]|uniref:Uncharacterized protein n=1 Tax=Corynebacterium lujinxingii TaxID=2763010 RepID=A0A7H0K0R1_9CORY|nr:hypothetical protein [Corynebacterium lujinxingii]MBC3179378.1 hypothetical protein [Corynebacterium lujinxingii]NNO11487.1 hypothetical protein [Corynebacterium lujinxingii]QNP90877.1 hypothetical protein IAU68_03680 [Corynebacterium lujinxingii]